MNQTASFAVFTSLVVIALVACSSSSDNATSSGTPCAQAKAVVDGCNDGGAVYHFDQAACEQSGQAGEAVSSCMITHKDSCDCLFACAVKQTCDP